MQNALDVVGLSKSFTVGSGSCFASARVLHRVDLVVRHAESIAIVGEAGCGKSTLLLCLAGLLRPDAGEIRWFGERDRALAIRRAVYHISPADLMRQGCADEPHVHLIDLVEAFTHVAQLESWIANRIGDDESIVIATRTHDVAVRYASRILTIQDGVLVQRTRARARVAEHALTAGRCDPF